jgi:hypothetical protein
LILQSQLIPQEEAKVSSQPSGDSSLNQDVRTIRYCRQQTLDPLFVGTSTMILCHSVHYIFSVEDSSARRMLALPSTCLGHSLSSSALAAECADADRIIYSSDHLTFSSFLAIFVCHSLSVKLGHGLLAYQSRFTFTGSLHFFYTLCKRNS